jgi:hypothetical protein
MTVELAKSRTCCQGWKGPGIESWCGHFFSKKTKTDRFWIQPAPQYYLEQAEATNPIGFVAKISKGNFQNFFDRRPNGMVSKTSNDRRVVFN